MNHHTVQIRCGDCGLRRGFTLVEALAATALLALLAAAIAGLSIGWMHAQRAVSHDADHGAPARRALLAIADDLRAAAPGSIIVQRTDATSIRCITAHPIPAQPETTQSTAPRHGWQRVRWFIDDDDNELVREAQLLDGPPGEPTTRRVVLLRATGLLARFAEEPETNSDPAMEAGRSRPVTLQLTLTNAFGETHHAMVALPASSLESTLPREPRRAGSR